MKGFQMSVEIAEKFFKRCLEREAITEPERLAIMNELIHEENVKILKEEQLKDLFHDKKILHVKGKKRA